MYRRVFTSLCVCDSWRDGSYGRGVTLHNQEVVAHWRQKDSRNVNSAKRRYISVLLSSLVSHSMLNIVITHAGAWESREYSDHPRLCVCDSVSVCLSVCLSVCAHDRTKTAETKISKQLKLAKGIVHQSRVFAHQWILGQNVKGQGHRVTECITSSFLFRAVQPCAGLSYWRWSSGRRGFVPHRVHNV